MRLAGEINISILQDNFTVCTAHFWCVFIGCMYVHLKALAILVRSSPNLEAMWTNKYPGKMLGKIKNNSVRSIVQQPLQG